MKVRARPKPVEQMPEWSKCCDELISHHLDTGEITVDVSDTHIPKARNCRFCHAVIDIAGRAARIHDGKYAGMMYPLQLLDLDEGPIQEGAA